MEGAELRRRVLAQHQVLRGLLGEIETLAERYGRAGADDLRAGEQLRERALEFYRRFAEHLDFEDRQLLPALRRTAQPGPKYGERLGHEHHEQRQLLEYLLGRLEQWRTPTLLVAREIQSFAAYVRQDMAHEEGTILGEVLLGTTARSPGSDG